MDEPEFPEPKANVSCRNIGWYFDLCADKKLDFYRVLRNVPFAREHLQDPAGFIDWQSFATLSDNFLNYLSETEIREASRYSWQTRTMRVYRIVGSLLYSVRELYSSSYGPMGFIAKLYPCDMSITEVYSGHLKISLRMKHGLTPCRTFHLTLAGQMSGLPESVGYSDANVQLHHHENGADFDVYYQPHGGLFAPLRRLLAWPFAIKNSAIELNLAHESLLEKYRELQTGTNKIKQVEQKATEIESRYHVLADNVSDVIWTMDMNLNFDYLSPSLQFLAGYDQKEAGKLKIEDLFNKEAVDNFEKYLARTSSENFDFTTSMSFDAEITKKDGSPVWIEVRSDFLLDESGKPKRLVGIAKDISERKYIQDMLNRSEENYQVITNTAQDAIFTFDDHGYITFANPSSGRVFNYSPGELVGISVKTIIPDAFGTSPIELEQLSSENIVLRGITKDLNSVSLEISFAKHEKQGRSYFTGIARDMSQRRKDEQERNQLQSQLLAAQKMESIGQLTGGIAHDFNNLLVAINGYAELGMQQSGDQKELTHYLSEIKLAGERAADLTQKLLAFSRRQIIEPSVLDLCVLVDGLKLMIQRLLPENINIEFNYSVDSLNVLADGGQVEQLLVNLAVNARDAMLHGGDLNITCYEQEIGEDYFNNHGYADPGIYAVIEVKDTGYGMSEEVKKRIFEPFFTTKPEGSGTGLGMAVVFGIVKQHNGFITVDSEVGEGTTFLIYLPRVDKSVTEQERKLPSSSGGSEQILVVEDNDQVRDLACLILKGAGYQIHEAADGLEAIEKFRELQNQIDLVVMDVVMPKMGGREVLQKMQSIKPDVKVIFTSGYSNRGIHTNFILEQGLEFIQKPYHTEVLRRKIRQVLDKHLRVA